MKLLKSTGVQSTDFSRKRLAHRILPTEVGTLNAVRQATGLTSVY
jgi:hypothetical protein